MIRYYITFMYRNISYAIKLYIYNYMLKSIYSSNCNYRLLKINGGVK